MYTENSKIACHKDATVGQAQATVSAGGTVELQWNTWPESHKGPVLDYLAKVDGEFTSATYDDLSFFKIDEKGLNDGSWASDELIANNNSWTVTIPSSIAPGSYVLRHEIIALHSAGQENGAQNYPQCINVEITGSGSETPSGVAANTFYTPDDAGILVNIYSGLTSYEIPGPALFDGASASNDTPAATSAVASTAAVTSVAASSSAVASSVSVQQAIQTSSATAVESPTPVATKYPAATSDAVAPIISQIVTAIPSGLLSSTLPSILPTGSANSTGPLPETPLPEGITLKDLLDWIAYILRNMTHGKGSGRNNRQHARQFA
jgi:hypothetical protein